MKYISLVLVSLASQVAAAGDDTIEKADFGGRALAAVWAAGNCPGLRLDHDRFAAVVAAYGVSIDDFEPSRAADEAARSGAGALERERRRGGQRALCADMPSRFDGGSFDAVVVAGAADATQRPSPVLKALEDILAAARVVATRTMLVELSIADDKCPGVAFDIDAALAAPALAGYEYDAPGERERIAEVIPTIAYEARGVGLDAWCEGVEARFGPGGTVEPGLAR